MAAAKLAQELQKQADELLRKNPRFQRWFHRVYKAKCKITKIYAKSATATEYLHNPVNEYTKVAATPYECDAAGNLD